VGNQLLDEYFISTYKLLMEYVTTKQAAERLRITPRRVQALIEAGRLRRNYWNQLFRFKKRLYLKITIILLLRMEIKKAHIAHFVGTKSNS
jgi:hypothetical protein